MKLPWQRDDVLAPIRKAVEDALAGVAPERGIVVIQNLTININSAQGGGAKVIVGPLTEKQEGKK